MRTLMCLVLFAWVGTFQVMADVPPPYEPYGIGVTMDQGDPFPKITSVAKGSPAALAGVKVGDQVIALNGTYSKTSAPFYFFARGLQGPKNSFAQVIVLRDGAQVLVFKVKRTVRG